MRTICIYHADCYDGFGAAWVVQRYYRGEVEFHRGVYATEPPDVTGKNVILVDFAYTRPVMKRLCDQAQVLSVMDHHASNRDMLVDLAASAPHVWVAFDKERSGAGITWDTLFEGRQRPPLLNRVEDRDLWRFQYDDSRLIHAALESYPMDFDVWTELMRRPLSELRKEGERCEALHWNHINMLLPITKRFMRINGSMVPVANVPITLCSDAGIELAKTRVDTDGGAFAATYMDTALGRQFSLRSLEDGPDVSKIAAAYGKLFGTSGGGHPHAAGFLAPRGWEGDSSISDTDVLGSDSEKPASHSGGEESSDVSVVEVAQGA